MRCGDRYLSVAVNERRSRTRRLARRDPLLSMPPVAPFAEDHRSTALALDSQLALPRLYGQCRVVGLQPVKKILLAVVSASSAQWIRLHGVKLGSNPCILGFPDIKLAPDSSILIGNDVSIFSSRWANPLRPSRPSSLVTLNRNANIAIGDRVGISSSVISCAQSIRIDEGTFIGAECVVTDTDFHGFPLHSNSTPRVAPVHIGANVFIGTRSIILKGVTIGRESIIGAASVVTTDVPERSLVAGNPAQVIRLLA